MSHVSSFDTVTEESKSENNENSLEGEAKIKEGSDL